MSDDLQQQIAYYRARAGEYDEWFYRLGRYDRGAELNQKWFDEVEIAMRDVRTLAPVGDALELAAGTGNWTVELATFSQTLTVIDASPEMIAINREKVGRDDVRYLESDLFAWQPDRAYDLVFFGFWLSHVPPERFDLFMAQVAKALRPGGRLWMIDSLPDDSSSAVNHIRYDPSGYTHTRKLNDGREYNIIKVFYDPADLQKQLAAHGIVGEIKTTGTYFWYGGGVKQE